MARNDLKQNPEAEDRRTDAEATREPEQVLADTDDTELPAELFSGEADEVSEEDLLLEKNLSEMMKNVSAGEATEREITADDGEAMFHISFSEPAQKAEVIEIPVPVEVDDSADELPDDAPSQDASASEDVLSSFAVAEFPDFWKTEENEKPEDMVQPAVEATRRGVFASFLGRGFKDRKMPEKDDAVLTEEEPEQTEEVPAPAESEKDELDFVTDSIPAAAALMAQAAAELSRDGKTDEDMSDMEPEETVDPAEYLNTDEEDAGKEQETDAEEKAPATGKPESPYMPLVRMVATLTVICCVVALLLAVVNAVTADVITANAEKKQSDAILRIFTEGNNVVAEGENKWMVYKDDTLLGYCAAVAPVGYGGAINMMVGVDTADQVVGVQIVDMKETSGVGSKAASDTFLSQYLGQSGSFAVGDNIDAIVGATVTSKAVTEGVNMALAMGADADSSVPETEPADAVPVETETEPTVSETEPETEKETETVPETEKETETEAEIEPETEKKPETIPPETVPPAPETKPETTPPAPETKPETRPPETKPETTPPAPETKPETTPPAPETKPETTPPAPETKPETTPPAPETEPETMPPAPETEPETTPPAPETEPETTPPAPETEPETTPPAPETEPETEPETVETEPETETETEPETVPETEPETETETEEETKKETTGSRLPIRY